MDWSAKWGLKTQSVFPFSFLTVCSVVIVCIHNISQSSPWRYGQACHYSLTVSSSCWLAGMPEDMRQPDIGTYILAGASWTEGCQLFFRRCFSLTCLIRSKTVSKSDRRKKKGKKRRRERGERSPPSFHRYDSVHAAASTIKLPLSVW